MYKSRQIYHLFAKPKQTEPMEGISQNRKTECTLHQSLQLSLLGLGGQVRHEEVAHFRGGLVQVVAHAVGAETLADDVEVETGFVVSISFRLRMAG